jgi:hypothetical protein
MLRKETQMASASSKELEVDSEEVIYKIDIPANRYDLLCLEGIARALNVFAGRRAPPRYTLADMTGRAMQRLVMRPETALVRPYVVAAILRGLEFDQSRYNSFIDLQDKLHQNLCRQRTLVAIGTHDLDTVQGPFSYEALPPEDIRFVPLKQTREFDARELLEHYAAHDQKLKRFVPIIQKSVVYPVILDADRNVLSLPPVINGARSAISLRTRNVFIECTATDLTKARVVLNTVCAMFSEFCERPFEVEPVEVVDAFGESRVYPDLAPRAMEVSVDYVNSCTGLGLSAAEMAPLLGKMQLEVAPANGGASLAVQVPISRSDVLHGEQREEPALLRGAARCARCAAPSPLRVVVAPRLPCCTPLTSLCPPLCRAPIISLPAACDVMEDVAIAFGYNNLPRRAATTVAAGRELPLNQLCELLRLEAAMAGFTEVLTWALCSRAENFDALRRPDDGATAVAIGNPATAEFEVCRSSLLQGALKTLGEWRLCRLLWDSERFDWSSGATSGLAGAEGGFHGWGLDTRSFRGAGTTLFAVRRRQQGHPAAGQAVRGLRRGPPLPRPRRGRPQLPPPGGRLLRPHLGLRGGARPAEPPDGGAPRALRGRRRPRGQAPAAAVRRGVRVAAGRGGHVLPGPPRRGVCKGAARGRVRRGAPRRAGGLRHPVSRVRAGAGSGALLLRPDVRPAGHAHERLTEAGSAPAAGGRVNSRVRRLFYF